MKLDYIVYQSPNIHELILLDMCPCPRATVGGNEVVDKFLEYYKSIYGSTVDIICHASSDEIKAEIRR